MAKKKIKKLSIDERLDILREAEQFFSDLGSAGENSERFGRVKAAALETVIECLDVFKDRVLKWWERTEWHLWAAIALVINEDFINQWAEKLSEEEWDFYKWWFGLALGILLGDTEAIDWLRELEKDYDEILEARASTKTIADLVK